MLGRTAHGVHYLDILTLGHPYVEHATPHATASAAPKRAPEVRGMDLGANILEVRGSVHKLFSVELAFREAEFELFVYPLHSHTESGSDTTLQCCAELIITVIAHCWTKNIEVKVESCQLAPKRQSATRQHLESRRLNQHIDTAMAGQHNTLNL